MSWSEAARPNRRRVLASVPAAVLAVTPLAGCFRPMLAEDSAPAMLIGRIELPAFDDRFGYHLNDSLRGRLGEADRPEYRLEIRTRLDKADLAIAQDNSVTRISLTAIADWALYPNTSGQALDQPLLERRTVSQSGYNSTASLFATRAAKLDVERRLARDLGERIARTLFARAGRLAAAPAPTAGGS